ncbi:uncharacterized protein METZ01_LOCUS430014, partial [marine metagenome]
STVSAPAKLGVNYKITQLVTGLGVLQVSPDKVSYAPDTKVSITAKPSNGYGFTGWSGSIEGNQLEVVLTMDGNKTVNAKFERLPSITKQIVGKTVVAGESVSFEVQASGGGSLAYTWFLNDTVIAGAIENKLLIEDVREKDAGAYRVKVSNAAGEVESEAATLAVHYTLSTSVTGSGTVSISPEAASYAPGTEVTLEAEPAEGFMLESWSGDASGKSNPLTVVMNGSKTIRADFAEIPATVNQIYVNGVMVDEGQVLAIPDQATVE